MQSVVLFRTFKILENLSSHRQPSLMVILFSAKVASKRQTIMVIISRMKLKKKSTYSESERTVRSLYNTENNLKWSERDVLNSESLS